MIPYPHGHREATRAKIVNAARTLFNRFGFDRVSIQQIMELAGLTHGGFYRHFASKSDLYAETLGCFFTDPGWKNNWEGVEVDLAAANVGAQIVHINKTPLVGDFASCSRLRHNASSHLRSQSIPPPHL